MQHLHIYIHTHTFLKIARAEEKIIFDDRRQNRSQNSGYFLGKRNNWKEAQRNDVCARNILYLFWIVVTYIYMYLKTHKLYAGGLCTYYACWTIIQFFSVYKPKFDTIFLMFHCLQLLSHIPFSFLSVPHVGKLIRKPGYFLHWCWWQVQITQVPVLTWESLSQPQPLTMIRNPGPFPVPILSTHSWTCMRAYLIFSMLHCVNNKPFHNLLVCVWHYQPWHLNQNLTWGSICSCKTVTEGI